MTIFFLPIIWKILYTKQKWWATFYWTLWKLNKTYKNEQKTPSLSSGHVCCPSVRIRHFVSFRFVVWFWRSLRERTKNFDVFCYFSYVFWFLLCSAKCCSSSAVGKQKFERKVTNYIKFTYKMQTCNWNHSVIAKTFCFIMDKNTVWFTNKKIFVFVFIEKLNNCMTTKNLCSQILTKNVKNFVLAFCNKLLKFSTSKTHLISLKSTFVLQNLPK